MGAQEGHVGDTDEGPFLAGPEPDDRALLRDLGGSIKVGKAHAAQVGRQADEDVPAKGDGVRPGACSLAAALGPNPPFSAVMTTGASSN